MSNQEILEKAIQKAINNGWDILNSTERTGFTIGDSYYGGNFVHWSDDTDDEDTLIQSDIEVIFNHDFAKALWGEKTVEEWYDDGGEIHEFMGGTLEYPYAEGAGMTYKVPKWKLHLQRMVIHPNPIKYLGENT